MGILWAHTGAIGCMVLMSSCILQAQQYTSIPVWSIQKDFNSLGPIADISVMASP